MKRWYSVFNYWFCSVLILLVCVFFVKVVNDINIYYEKFILENGFIVIVYEDCKVLVVVVVVWYKVGLKDELLGKFGFVYLFEYFMFNGIENYDDEWFKFF